MGEKKHRSRPWTTEELRLLRECYHSWPPRYDLLPHLERQTVHSKAYRLGLTRRRSRTGLFAHVTPTQWAYLAAFIDGEGSVELSVNHDRRRGKSYERFWVVITNTHLPTIQWIALTFPPGNMTVAMPAGERNGRRRLKTLYQVKWTHQASARELLHGVLPYMITKREKAETVLAWIESRPKFAGSSLNLT